jgi:hypothetical protein
MANRDAKKVYDTIIKALDGREWVYQRDDDELTVTYKVGGDDLPMHFILRVDEERNLIRLFSPMPCNFPEDKRIEGAIATCYATNKLANGCFEYDLSDGMAVFRMANPYENCDISVDLINYMISVGCNTVDEYNDKLFMIAKGMLKITDFIEQ